jgi:hypothetical protein
LRITLQLLDNVIKEVKNIEMSQEDLECLNREDIAERR